MSIRLATTDAEIAACYPVMRALRPHVAESQFVARVRRQEQAGYRLAYLEEQGRIMAVAGFRMGENLASGRYLYVDDLVTLTACRSRGHGARLLAWLREQACSEGCRELLLDSGLQRKDAHRFYQREGMAASAFRFSEALQVNRTPADPEP